MSFIAQQSRGSMPRCAQARQALMAMGARKSAKPHLRPGLCRPSRHGVPLALGAWCAGVFGPGRRVHHGHVEAQGLRDERGQLVVVMSGLAFIMPTRPNRSNPNVSGTSWISMVR